MPSRGRTGLVVPVPAADPLLDAVTQRHPDAARPAFVAHVSLLYPFLPAEEVDAAAVEWLRSFAACSAPVTLLFDEVEQAPGFFALPAVALEPMAKAVRDQWPQVIPYGGRYGRNPGSHLTVAMGTDADESDRIAGYVREFLPLTGVADQLWLVEYDETWRITHTVRFLG
jgi:hypothetical protein